MKLSFAGLDDENASEGDDSLVRPGREGFSKDVPDGGDEILLAFADSTADLEDGAGLAFRDEKIAQETEFC